MKRIGVLIGIAFVDMIGFAMVFPLLPLYAQELKAPAWVIGWMIASFSIAQLASAPLWGRVSDRYGRRPALLVGMSAAAIAFAVFAFSTNIWMLFLSRLVQGAGGGTTGVVQAYVGDSIEPRDRAKALGWISAATSAGVAIGSAIGSLSAFLGREAPGLVAATLCVINVAVAWRWLPESHPERRSPGQAGHAPATPDGPPPERRPISAVVWDVFRNPGGEVPRLVWIYAVGMLGFNSMTGVLALYLQACYDVTVRTIGLFFMYVGSLSFVMRALVLGRLVDRFGETRVMRTGALMLAVGLAAVPMPERLLGHTIPGLALVIALVPIGTALLFPAVSALTTRRAPRTELGQVMGVQQAFGSASRVIAPIWATAAFQAFGEAFPFYIAGGVVAVVSLLAFRVRHEAPTVQAAGAGS